VPLPDVIGPLAPVDPHTYNILRIATKITSAAVSAARVREGYSLSHTRFQESPPRRSNLMAYKPGLPPLAPGARPFVGPAPPSTSTIRPTHACHLTCHKPHPIQLPSLLPALLLLSVKRSDREI
jgi:hypothetical protein